MPDVDQFGISSNPYQNDLAIQQAHSSVAVQDAPAQMQNAAYSPPPAPIPSSAMTAPLPLPSVGESPLGGFNSKSNSPTSSDATAVQKTVKNFANAGTVGEATNRRELFKANRQVNFQQAKLKAARREDEVLRSTALTDVMKAASMNPLLNVILSIFTIATLFIVPLKFSVIYIILSIMCFVPIRYLKMRKQWIPAGIFKLSAIFLVTVVPIVTRMIIK